MKRVNKAYIVVVLCLLLSVTSSAQKTASLPRSSPEQQGIASADLLAFVDAADKEVDAMNSFMLVRHGHVVAEGCGLLTTATRLTCCTR